MTDISNKTESACPAIRPFHFSAPEAELAELRRRIEATRWPDKEIVNDSSQGVQLATIQKLAQHWATKYDWRAIESKINALPNFLTHIDGLDIHFIHVRSKHENALPLLMAHGWPGSVIELMKVIGPLTDPTAHGGSAADAFSLVIPSMPGYGFSQKPTEAGWNPERMADAYIELMERLGYTRYGAQGGDWGSIVVDLMAVKAPPGLIGIHSNMPGVIPPHIDAALFRGEPIPAGLAQEEQLAAEQLANTYRHIGYAIMMGDRPQSLTGLSDSPVGLAAFMLDHDPKSYEMIARSIDGQPEGLSPDDVLDNITLFWLTNTAISSARLYWENRSTFFAVKGVNIPVAVSVFPDELYASPKSWTQKAYPKLVHYNVLPKGGHFAAWEQPAMFSQEVRAGFKSLRYRRHQSADVYAVLIRVARFGSLDPHGLKGSEPRNPGMAGQCSRCSKLLQSVDECSMRPRMHLSISTETLWIDTPHGRLFGCRWFPEGGVAEAQKPPIILFHDSLGCVALWRDFPQQLCRATGHEVIAYDRLGFGQSDACPGPLPLSFIGDEAVQFFAHLKAALGIERFIAFGHSVGGAMAAACASLYGQGCTALITVSAQAFVEDRTLEGIRVAQEQFALPGQMARLERYHGAKAPWVLSAWTDTWLSPAFSDWTIESTVGDIHCPLLAIHGQFDEYGSDLHPKRIARLSTGPGDYLIVDDCHHVPHREAPQTVLAAVSEFLGAAVR